MCTYIHVLLIIWEHAFHYIARLWGLSFPFSVFPSLIFFLWKFWHHFAVCTVGSISFSLFVSSSFLKWCSWLSAIKNQKLSFINVCSLNYNCGTWIQIKKRQLLFLWIYFEIWYLADFGELTPLLGACSVFSTWSLVWSMSLSVLFHTFLFYLL